MPTPKRGPRLAGGPAQQKSMLRNQATELFRHGRALGTVMIWIAFFMCLLMVNGLSTWLPKLMVESGYALDSSLTFSIVMNVGAIVGDEPPLRAVLVLDGRGGRPRAAGARADVQGPAHRLLRCRGADRRPELRSGLPLRPLGRARPGGGRARERAPDHDVHAPAVQKHLGKLIGRFPACVFEKPNQKPETGLAPE